MVAAIPYSSSAATGEPLPETCPQPDEPGASFGQFDRLFERLMNYTLETQGDWRIPQDVVDRVYDRFVDRWLDGRPPQRPVTWALCVLRNEIRKAPDRIEWRRSRFASIDNTALADRLTRTDRTHLRRFIHEHADVIAASLSRAERHALHSMLDHSTMREAADVAGMTLRDLRTRRRRIVAKLRRILPELRPPSPPLGS